MLRQPSDVRFCMDVRFAGTQESLASVFSFETHVCCHVGSINVSNSDWDCVLGQFFHCKLSNKVFSAIMVSVISNISSATEYTEAYLYPYLSHDDTGETSVLDMHSGAPYHAECKNATEYIRVGSCIFHWSQVANLELMVLYQLHHEIQSRIRMPMSYEDFLACQTPADATAPAKRSWSGYMESSARCVAAFQKTADAAEPSECDAIAATLCSYASNLLAKMAARNHGKLIAMIYEYIENRVYDLSMKKVVNNLLEDTGDASWNWVGVGRPRDECVALLQTCTEAVAAHGSVLRH